MAIWSKTYIFPILYTKFYLVLVQVDDHDNEECSSDANDSSWRTYVYTINFVLAGLVKSPFSTQSSTVATPVTPGAPVSFMISEIGGPVDLTLDLESSEKTKKQKPPRPPPPLTRGMSKKGSNESDSSDSTDGIFRGRAFSSGNMESAPDAIECAKFALTYTKKHGKYETYTCNRVCEVLFRGVEWSRVGWSFLI